MIDEDKIFKKCSSNRENIRNNLENFFQLYSFFENERKKIKKSEQKIEKKANDEDYAIIHKKIKEMNNISRIINENYMKYYVSKINHENLSYE